MNEIHCNFLEKIGHSEYCPTNFIKFETCGEFTICDELWQLGYLDKYFKDKLWYFKKRRNK